MTRPINKTTNEFLASLSRADIHPDTIKQATKRVKLLIGEFERRDENRIEGGKAVRKGPRKRVRTTLKHFIRAAKDAKLRDRSSMSQKARDLLRAIRTFQDFEAMEEKARGFAGLSVEGNTAANPTQDKRTSAQHHDWNIARAAPAGHRGRP